MKHSQKDPIFPISGTLFLTFAVKKNKPNFLHFSLLLNRQQGRKTLIDGPSLQLISIRTKASLVDSPWRYSSLAGAEKMSENQKFNGKQKEIKAEY